jgi:aquaporin Z
MNTLSYVTEFIGTFFFLTVIMMSTGSGKGAGLGNVAPLAIAAGLLGAICFGGAISGGHFNPAVSVMMFLNKALPASDLVPYVGAQVLGGMGALYFANASKFMK